MYKNLKTPAAECFKNENYHVYRKLFPAKKLFFKMDPSPRKLQDSGNKQNKSKILPELSNYVH